MPADAQAEPPAPPHGAATVVQETPPAHESGCAPGADGAPGSGASGDRYELLGEIARGGMGIVFRARDRVLDREVGLKTLSDVPHAGRALAARFRAEAQITGQLQHPNVPPVHDLGTLPDGRPFLAMKLIKGRTLDALLRERASPADGRGALLAVFEKVAQGVAYAHDHGVLHRDLKPLNVMVGDFGEVQVMDWGLAKVLRPGAAETELGPEGEPSTEIRPARDGSDETRPGSIFGTPAYMPREQAIGAVDQIDTRSDVFSLGGILCAVLTGKPPYVGGTAETTRQLAAVAKLDDALARLGACGAEPELVALCTRCLAPERDARPSTAGEVAKAVAHLRAEAEQRARRAELERVRADGERARAETRALEQRKRRRAQVALLGALLVIALGVVAFAWWNTDQIARRSLEEGARRAKGEQEVQSALAEVGQLRARGNTESGSPKRWRLTLANARSALRRAAAAIEAAPVSDELRQQYAVASAELERDEADAETADLCENWLTELFGQRASDGITPATFARKIDTILGRVGIDLNSQTPERVGGTLRAHRLRDPLTMLVLFSGFYLDRSPSPRQAVVRYVAEHAHPLQSELRTAAGKGQLSQLLVSEAGQQLTSAELLGIMFAEITRVRWIAREGEVWGDEESELVLDEAIRRNPGNRTAHQFRVISAIGRNAKAVFEEVNLQLKNPKRDPNYQIQYLPLPDLPQRGQPRAPQPLTQKQLRNVIAGTNAVALHPDSALLHWAAGDLLFEVGNYDLAAIHFQTAVRLGFDAEHVLVGCGDALMATGAFARAQEMYTRVVERPTAARSAELSQARKGLARCAILFAFDRAGTAQLSGDQRRELRFVALKQLRHWVRDEPSTKEAFLVTRDPAFRFVRDRAHLDQLPPDELGLWLPLWDEITNYANRFGRAYAIAGDTVWRLPYPGYREPAPAPREARSPDPSQGN